MLLFSLLYYVPIPLPCVPYSFLPYLLLPNLLLYFFPFFPPYFLSSLFVSFHGLLSLFLFLLFLPPILSLFPPPNPSLSSFLSSLPHSLPSLFLPLFLTSLLPHLFVFLHIFPPSPSPIPLPLPSLSCVYVLGSWK